MAGAVQATHDDTEVPPGLAKYVLAGHAMQLEELAVA